jgi:hypothetical protein
MLEAHRLLWHGIQDFMLQFSSILIKFFTLILDPIPNIMVI